MKYLVTVVILFIGLSTVSSQATTDITVEDIWRDYKFIPKSVPGFNFLNDGRHFTRLIDSKVIKKFDITTGAFVEDLFDASDIAGQLGFDGEISDYSMYMSLQLRSFMLFLKMAK